MIVAAYASLLVFLVQPFLARAHPAPRHDKSRNTKEFDLTLTWEQYAPDGFSREMMLVNGQMPGPVLEIDQDDWVIVRVHNKSPFNSSVHFHGIEMENTPWSDGVPGVTQRPILPGASFTHKFAATQYGSFWYHSHFLGQMEDGLFGAVVIHPRPEDPKPFKFISGDANAILAMEAAERNVAPLVISDFMHITSDQKWEMTTAAGFEDSCYDSIVFNGKGSVSCLAQDVITANLNDVQKAYLGMVPGASMTDKACLPPSVMIAVGGGEGNESALLPGVFSGCKETKGPVEVITAYNSNCTDSGWTAIDIVGAIGFVTGIFSIDGHDMWVYAMDGTYIEPQKVQGIPVTNGDRFSILVNFKKPGDYKMRFNAVSAPQMLTGHAILRVDGASDNSASAAYINVVGLPLNKDVVFFDQNTAPPYPPDAPAERADVLFNLNMKVDGATYLWAMNSTRLMPMFQDFEEPVLFHPDPNAHDNVTISTKHNEWVDLVFFASVFPMPPHPIHKHGTKMWQIGAGTGPFKWDSVEDAMKEIPKQFNLKNPPKRDAFASLPAIEDVSWVVVRYQATNPGPWLLHCHVNNHLVGGMMMVIQDGVDAWPEIPADYLNYGL